MNTQVARASTDCYHLPSLNISFGETARSSLSSATEVGKRVVVDSKDIGQRLSVYLPSMRTEVLNHPERRKRGHMFGLSLFEWRYSRIQIRSRRVGFPFVSMPLLEIMNQFSKNSTLMQGDWRSLLNRDKLNVLSRRKAL
ncbi:hypothetical protein IM543_02785 [Massilia sp. UMI-21]|nr:hypothetical protein IM543_02785 [Massilia sp. UMI-21]